MKEPEQYHLFEVIDLKPEEIELVCGWVLKHAKLRRINHAVSTSRDDPSRSHSWLRKTRILNLAPKPTSEMAGTAIGTLLGLCLRAPDDVADIVSRVYTALRGPAEQYFGMSLDFVDDKHAAVGHIYYPGDADGETHCDLGPTVPWLIRRPKNYGTLWVGRDPQTRGIDQIRANAWQVLPEQNSFTLFNGMVCPHVVDGLPEFADGYRLGVNFSYRPMGQYAVSVAGTSHPRKLAMMESED